MYNYLIIFIDNYIEKICKEVQISLLKDAIVCAFLFQNYLRFLSSPID